MLKFNIEISDSLKVNPNYKKKLDNIKKSLKEDENTNLFNRNDFDEMNCVFYLERNGNELFTYAHNNKRVNGVCEVIFDTLLGFIETIGSLESGKNNVQHMFLDGSGYLRIKKNDKDRITIQYENTSYEILNSFHAVPLWEWYSAVAGLGYQIFVFFDKNGIETDKLKPFLELRRDLDRLKEKSQELSKTSI